MAGRTTWAPERAPAGLRWTYLQDAAATIEGLKVYGTPWQPWFYDWAFNAPRELVFDAWTTPSLLQRWMLGPPGWTMPVCEIDLRPGGTWRCVWRREDGSEMEIRGAYKEVVPHERLVNTEMFDVEPFNSGEPAIVFIHGWACDSNYWRAQIPEFKKKYTVVTVDHAASRCVSSQRFAGVVDDHGRGSFSGEIIVR